MYETLNRTWAGGLRATLPLFSVASPLPALTASYFHREKGNASNPALRLTGTEPPFGGPRHQEAECLRGFSPLPASRSPPARMPLLGPREPLAPPVEARVGGGAGPRRVPPADAVLLPAVGVDDAQALHGGGDVREPGRPADVLHLLELLDASVEDAVGTSRGWPGGVSGGSPQHTQTRLCARDKDKVGGVELGAWVGPPPSSRRAVCTHTMCARVCGGGSSCK